MITYEEAIRIIDEHAKPLAAKRVHVSEGRGRFLAEDVVAQVDSPPFANSAVDGFGKTLADLAAKRLLLADTIKAGDDGLIEVPSGHAVRIFTGAPVPSGIAAIAMQEDCEVAAGYVNFAEASEEGDHIRPSGDDFRAGQTVLTAGAYLGPPALAIAASAGASSISVVGVPKICLLTTGSELVDVDEKLRRGQIYDSNSLALSTAVNELHDQWESSRASDDPHELSQRLKDAMAGDVVITCGGVSVGEYDLLKEEFAAFGVIQRFWSVAIKPGKPIYFGTCGEKLVFGLPGNPVSALVTFFLFVRPAILKVMGHPDPWPKPLRARFEGNTRKSPARMEFLRGNMAQEETGLVARSLSGQGSHMMADMAAANCLIHFHQGATELRSGEIVEVTPLNWGISSTGL